MPAPDVSSLLAELDELRCQAENEALGGVDTGGLYRYHASLRANYPVLRSALREREDENKALRETRQRGCDCNDEDACAFARERDEARAEVSRLTAENERLAARVERLRDICKENAAEYGKTLTALTARLEEAKAHIERMGGSHPTGDTEAVLDKIDAALKGGTDGT